MSLARSLLVLAVLGPAYGQDIPAPIEINPSGYWDGNDGPWSTFTIGIGTPPQAIRVIPSFAQNAVTYVMPEECVGDKYGYQNCSDSRGGVFRYNDSSTWHSSGQHEIDIFPALGIKKTFLFGTDTVGPGVEPHVSRMSNQTVAGMKAPASSYTGAVGISPKSLNLTGDDPMVPTFFESLRSSTRIAGRSWSYTAGIVNRKILGSLILGGYDASRMDETKSKPLSFKMTNETLREISVGLHGIGIFEGPAAALSAEVLKDPVTITVEPVISRIWLPINVCQAFEKSFGLSWNETSQLYYINGTQHASLLARNITITFVIGDTTLRGRTIGISIDYADFVLNAVHPLTDRPSRYFPVQRGYSNNQIVLGRAFLQAAHLIADYDRMTLNISQANFDASTEKRVYAIVPPVLKTSTSSNQARKGLSSSSVAGVVVGVLLVLVILFASVYYARRKHVQRSSNNLEIDGRPKTEMDATSNVIHEKGFGEKLELDASHGRSEVSGEAAPCELHEETTPIELDTGSNFKIAKN